MRETSLEAFQTMEIPEAMILDGDHNYYTVSEELRLLAERAGDELPLLLLHDVAGPTGGATTTSTPSRSPSDAADRARVRPVPGRREHA